MCECVFQAIVFWFVTSCKEVVRH